MTTASERRGITLLELIITMGLATGILVLVTLFALDITNFGLFLGDRLETERELEQTLRTFITEVRSMEPGENGAYPIADAQAESFTFFSDIDADGQTEQVRYFVSGTTLLKGVTEPDGTPPTYDPLGESVRDVVHHVVPGPAVFTYWESGWIGEMASLSAPVNPSDVRFVRMEATVDRDVTALPGPSTQGINVTIRNLRGEI
jgi:hypothetical protein